MELYEVWREGYQVSGNEGTAVKVGEITASSFEEAVCELAKDPNTGIKYRTGDNTPHIWGMSLFPTEAEARKTFG